jgi:hypothetical protein
MMKRFIGWASLLIGLAGTSTAQKLDRPVSPPIAGQHVVTMPLPNRNSLVLHFDDWNDLSARRNVDSVLRLFVVDFHALRDTAGLNTGSRSATYALEEDGQRTLNLVSHPPSSERYYFRPNEEPVQLKVLQDTLLVDDLRLPKRISNNKSTGANSQTRHLRFYLVLNRLEDVETLLPTGLNLEVEKAIRTAQSYQEHDLFNQRLWSRVTFDPSAAPTIRAGGNPNAVLFLTASVGLGVTRNQLYTTLNGEIGFSPNNGKIGGNLSWNEYFFFEGRGDGTSRIVRNSFLNAGINVSRERRSDGQAGSLQGNRLTIGYLVRRNGNFFEANTWRLAGTITPFKFSVIEPELYWNGLFKKAFPGVRINVAF